MSRLLDTVRAGATRATDTHDGTDDKNTMTSEAKTRVAQRGVILMVVVFIATAVAALAAISSGRTVQASRKQQVLENETRAYNSAYAQLHMAMNVVNGSPYNADNQNVEIRNAVAGINGGTVAGVDAKSDPLSVYDPDISTGRLAAPAGIHSGYVSDDSADSQSSSLDKASTESNWLDDPTGVVFGFIQGTNVRVYTARDYIKRLQKLKGETVTDVDPAAASDAYFVLEAAGRAGDSIRMMSALVRETEPFSSFVFFQNRSTLGVSGSPRGLIHANDTLAFYFPNGNYSDPVSSVNGFDYQAGANETNTNLRDANAAAKEVTLEGIDFDKLKVEADLFTGTEGLDAEIRFSGDGRARIREYTKPRFEMVERSYTYDKYVGYHYEPRTRDVQVQVGEVEVTYTVDEITGYNTETYTVTETVVTGTVQETYDEEETYLLREDTEIRYRDVQVQTGTEEITRSREDPIYATRTVEKTRIVTKLVPLSEVDPNAGGGTVGGDGTSEIMVEIQVEETYTVEETYVSGYETVTWVETRPIYETVQEAYEVQVPVYATRTVQKVRDVDVTEERDVEYTREVAIIEPVTKTRMDPIYETQVETYDYRVNDYEEVTVTWEEEIFIAPEQKSETYIDLSNDIGGTIYIDGRVTELEGDLNGRLTIIGNEGVRITDSIQYVDNDGDTAMVGGTDASWTSEYKRNSAYEGQSVLGVVARDDIVFTSEMPDWAELNASLMSVEGRVGIDGFVTKSDGDLVKSSSSSRATHMTAEQLEQWRAYDRTGYRERAFQKDSLRRIGGTISNNRILETYIRMIDGSAQVDAGFTSGNMQFDINLLFNPPPSFVEVPRPVVMSFVPVFLQANSD
ncbi:MAG: hypothetical protein ACYTEG_05415 [Planctomycetota bacterium]|jgi:hypothetical protein